MPVAGLVCRTCLCVTPVSARHWMVECDDPTMDPGLLQAALGRQAQRDARMVEVRKSLGEGHWFEVSELLGGVRDVFLRRHFPYYPEAQSFNSMEIGDAVGARAEEGLAAAGWKVQVAVKGKLHGVNVFGFIDAVAPEWMVIRDTKFKGSGAWAFQKQRGIVAGEVDAAQVNSYRLLALQMGEPVPPSVGLEVWYGTNNAATDREKKPLDSWFRARAPHMTEAQIGLMYVAGSGSSVKQNAAWLLEAEMRVAAGEPASEVADSIPTTCETMFGRQKCQSYCGPALTCAKLRGLPAGRVGKATVKLPE